MGKFRKKKHTLQQLNNLFMTKNENWLPSKENIENFSLLKDMLDAQKEEFDLLSKKKSDDHLNEMKIKMVNRVLEPLNKLLENEPSHHFLDILNKEDMPTHSDVVLIISQYQTALDSFKDKYYKLDGVNPDGFGLGRHRWNIKEDPILETKPYEQEEE